MVPVWYLASFRLLYCYDGMGMYSWFHFFSFLSLLSKLLILEQLFFRWFHVVPVVFGSFLLTCYLEPSWFPFLKILSPGGETNHFCKKKKKKKKKTGFFRWFHVVPHVFGSFMLTCYKEPRWFPFQVFNPLSEINHFWDKIAFFRWFHVVPGVFGSFMLTCYMEPSWFPFADFKPAW